MQRLQNEKAQLFKMTWVLCDHLKKKSSYSHIFKNKIALLCNFCFRPTEWCCVEFQG